MKIVNTASSHTMKIVNTYSWQPYNENTAGRSHMRLKVNISVAGSVADPE